jgi:P4 family phage/plasmid primase-like protien
MTTAPPSSVWALLHHVKPDERKRRIVDAANLLWVDGVHELRIPGTDRGTISGYYDTAAVFANGVMPWIGRGYGIYMTVNRVRRDLLARAANRTITRARYTTCDADVEQRIWLPLDFDPVRPAGISASDKEHALALERAAACRAWLIERGIDERSIVSADSGNGAHLLIAIRLPNTQESTVLVRRCIEAVSLFFTDDRVLVDRTTYNAARIWKVYGTLACKGSSTTERPWREAHLLHVPAPLQIAPEPQLAALATSADSAAAGGEPLAAHRYTAAQGARPETRDPHLASRTFDIDIFIHRHFAGVVKREAPWCGGRKWVLSVCPFNPDHTNDSAVIIEHASGALTFRCLHNSCTDYRWQDLRQLVDGPRSRISASASQSSDLGSETPLSSAAMHPPSRESQPPTAIVETHEPGPGIRNLTDCGNAERLVARHGHDLRYCFEWGAWVVWDDLRWKRDWSCETIRKGKDTVRYIDQEGTNIANEKYRKAIERWAKASESGGKINAMLELAKSEPGIPVAPEELDADPWLFNCLNGTIDLRSGELRPHRREDLITKLAPVEYDPTARAPRWRSFLDRVMDGNTELISFLQRALGYTLTGTTSESCLFFLYGTGRNGKSIFLGAVEHVMGDYAQATRPETIMLKRGGEIPNDIAALAGARFVPTAEVEEGKRLAENLVKQLTGGDTISARFLRAEFFNFTPTFKIWVAGNHKPQIIGIDNGIWERIRLIPFSVTIPAAERDTKLAEKLRAEAAGILTWMVEGCLAWQQRGLDVPEIVRTATHEYRLESDRLADFINERCVRVLGTTCSVQELYDAYRSWSIECGLHPWGRSRFNTHMKNERGFRTERGPGGRYRWIGIGLRPNLPGAYAIHDDPPSRDARDGNGPSLASLPSPSSAVSTADHWITIR